MDSELDLRTLLRTALTYWRILAVATLIAGLAALALTFVIKRPVRASADILISPNSEQITLDSRYSSRDATLLTTSSFQRQGLIALASSSTVEAQVAEQLIADGQLNAYVPGALQEKISVVAQGDLVRIIASDRDMDKAVALATAWSSTYERIVAESYSRSNAASSQIDSQVTGARQRYDAAQKALEDFLATSERVAVDQQILRVTGILEGSRASGTFLYTQYLTRVQELDLILADASALREQSASGSGSDLSDSLSVLALRARVAGGAVLPVQLRFDDPATLASAGRATLQELDSLISVLGDERERMLKRSHELAQSLAGGDESSVGLTPEARKGYERDLTTLISQRELLDGKEAALTQQRDVALSSLELLLRKSDEDQIARTVSQVEVRIVSVGPVAPVSLLLQLLINLTLGVAVGVAAGVILILFQSLRRLRRVAGLPSSDRPADRPAATL